MSSVDAHLPLTQPGADAGDRRDIARITWLGLGINLGLSLGKFLAGWFGNSRALIADGIHSASDIGTDLAVIVGVRFWSRPPDRSHPYGHARIETVVTVLIGLVLAGVAIGIGYDGITALAGILGGEAAHNPSMAALIIACISVVSKEWVYQRTARIAKRVKSPALLANAWHHRADAMSSLPVVLVLVLMRINPAWAFLDPVGALFVSVLILKTALDIAKPAINTLVDRAAPARVEKALGVLAGSRPGVNNIHALRTRYVGSGMMVDLHVEVDPELTVRAGHAITEDVRLTLLREGPGVVDVLVHLDYEDDVDTHTMGSPNQGPDEETFAQTVLGSPDEPPPAAE